MILYFSGTGNTRHFAEILGAKLNEPVISMDEGLKEPRDFAVNSEDGNLVVMFPIYSWGIPPVVENLLNQCILDVSPTVKIWLVVTCGDDCGLVANAFRKIMKKRGFSVSGAFSVQMPNTYVCMKGFDVDSQDVEKHKISVLNERLDAICRVIESGKKAKDDVVEGSFPWFKSKIIRPWFIRNCMSPKPFKHTDACTACGICRCACPMQNIASDAKGQPIWGNHCAMCLRCYHICPSHAVAYGKTTDGKGQSKIFIKPFVRK